MKNNRNDFINKFLNDLNYELRFLNRNERNKSLESYKEMILDYTEQGFREEDVIKRFENPKTVSLNVLNSYNDENKGGSYLPFKHFNKLYVLGDICSVILSFIFAYTISYVFPVSQNITSHSDIYTFQQYFISLLFIIPIFMICNFIFRIYHLSQIRFDRLSFSNIIAAMCFDLILFLTGQVFFSRLLLVLFVVFVVASTCPIRMFSFKKI